MQTLPGENAYLMESRTSAIHTVSFPRFLNAYEPLISIANVRLFASRQGVPALHAHVSAARGFGHPMDAGDRPCMATIGYGQLIAENAVRLGVPVEIVSAIFHTACRGFQPRCADPSLASGRASAVPLGRLVRCAPNPRRRLGACGALLLAAADPGAGG